MDEHRYFPNLDRLSMVTAMVLLAYSSAAFIHIPTNSLSLQLPGFLFVIQINFFTILSLVVLGMAAAGTDWVIAGHPHIGEESRWRHWFLPALTALVIGVPLNEIAVSAAWWIIFGMGGLLFAGVLISEYISVDLSDLLYPVAVVSLSVVSMALFLILTIAVRGAGLRLYAIFSAIIPAAALVCGRILSLRLPGKWLLPWITAITVIMAQFAFSLFYFPLKPIQFGLILFGLAYALISLVVNIEEGVSTKRFWVEPAVMFLVILILSFIL